MFAAPGFMAYRPPQNVVFSDPSESITRYYIGATDGPVSNLILNEFPETTIESRGNLSVTYPGTTLVGATGNQFSISLQDGAISIPESRVDVNITLLGRSHWPITMHCHTPSPLHTCTITTHMPLLFFRCDCSSISHSHWNY